MTPEEIKNTLEARRQAIARSRNVPAENLVWAKGASRPEPFTLAPKREAYRIIFIDGWKEGGPDSDNPLWQLWYAEPEDMKKIREALPQERREETAGGLLIVPSIVAVAPAVANEPVNIAVAETEEA